MGDHGEVGRHVRLVASQGGEQHVGQVVSDDGLDVSVAGDLSGDPAEERHDLGPAA